MTTALKVSGRALQRSAINLPHVTLVPARVGSLRRKTLVAACVRPGTELAFSSTVKVANFGYLVRQQVETLSHATAIFRQVNKDEPRKHHDALEFPDGRIFLLTQLFEGQEATVLQLPAQPASAGEANAQTRIAYVD